MFFYQVFDTDQMFGAIVFAFFSSGELQPWAKSNEGNFIKMFLLFPDFY